ncbi:MAG TPA: hypothetical protein VFF98_17235 [Novosphingobium sp.]|nr:hypothetical protein [Novosphingobium sp.]
MGKAQRLSAVAAQLAGQHRTSAKQFAQRHPAPAARERALRRQVAQIAEDYGHKRQGTPATHAHAAAEAARPGTLLRLFRSGALSADEFGWAMEIGAEHARVGADVAVKGASLETRVDRSRQGDEHFFESLGRVRRAQAYSAWRRAIMVDLPARTGRARVAAGGQGAAALAMIVDEVSIREAGRRWRMSERRARKLLLDALALWPDYLAEARDGIDERDLARVCARLG